MWIKAFNKRSSIIVHQFSGLALLLLLLSFSTPLQSQEETKPAPINAIISYRGKISLPTALTTGDEFDLAKGKYDIEVRHEHNHYSLVFTQEDTIVLIVNGKALTENKPGHPGQLRAWTGTLFLTTEDLNKPIELGTKWHTLKRSWNATLRTYQFNEKEKRKVQFLFHLRTKPGQWSKVEFILHRKEAQRSTPS